MSPARRLLAVATAMSALSSAGCELEETSITEPLDVVVAETFLEVGERTARAFTVLHRTIGGQPSGGVPPRGLIRVTPAGKPPIEIGLVDLGVCFEGDPPPGFVGSCYSADPDDLVDLEPGIPVDLRIEVSDGRVITGSTRIPDDFDFVDAGGPDDICVLQPQTNFNLVWSQSPSAWAYISETLIFGLRAAYEPRGITVEEDPLLLLGLSISATDTTIVFPRQFGVFDRFDQEAELLAALQAGLPDNTAAVVRVGAVDRNYVNWVRGGTFNPSGQVRIPSVEGEGTGAFASVVIRTVNVDVQAGAAVPVRCIPG